MREDLHFRHLYSFFLRNNSLHKMFGSTLTLLLLLILSKGIVLISERGESQHCTDSTTVELHKDNRTI